MRNIFKFLMMGLMMVAFVAGTATSSFAQEPTEQETLYKTFTDNRKGPEVEKVQVAIKAGEDFLQKFGTDAALKPQADYITKLLPTLKVYVVERPKQMEREAIGAAITAKNWTEVFAKGKAVLAREPDNVDMALTLASVGFDNAVLKLKSPVEPLDNETVSIAKTAIQKLEEGKPSASGNYGDLGYVYKTPEFADGKSNALGWMNYTVALITYEKMKNPKEAAPYAYKATQYNSFTKGLNTPYRYIGTWYQNEANALADKIAANNTKLDALTAITKDAQKTEEEKAKAVEESTTITNENKTAADLQKAYFERAIDAFSRASKVAATEKDVTPAYKQSLANLIQKLYELRFEKKDGLAAYQATLTAKPFPDPTSPVTPVVEVPTTATTTTTGGAATVAPAADTAKTNTATATTPKTTVPVKAVTTTPVKAATTTPAAKTPAPKKGNR